MRIKRVVSSLLALSIITLYSNAEECDNPDLHNSLGVGFGRAGLDYNFLDKEYSANSFNNFYVAFHSIEKKLFYIDIDFFYSTFSDSEKSELSVGESEYKFENIHSSMKVYFPVRLDDNIFFDAGAGYHYLISNLTNSTYSHIDYKIFSNAVLIGIAFRYYPAEKLSLKVSYDLQYQFLSRFESNNNNNSDLEKQACHQAGLSVAYEIYNHLDVLFMAGYRKSYFGRSSKAVIYTESGESGTISLPENDFSLTNFSLGLAYKF